MNERTSGVELREISAAILRGRIWIAAGAAVGLLVGAAVAFGIAPRYEARTSVLIQSETDNGISALSKLSGLLGGMGGGLSGSKLETEVAIFQSRTVIGEVVDSLGLQVEVLEPAAAAPLALFSAVRVDARTEGHEYSFERAGNGYEVSGDGFRGTAVPGTAVRLPDAVLTLAATGLPAKFRIELMDRESAVDKVEKALDLSTEQGDLVEVKFRAKAPAVSAGVLNGMVSTYLRRRTTTDRGTNQHRYEFLSEHVDSITHQLMRAEEALRQDQETSGVLDPEVQGQTELERAMEVQAELEGTAVEARALEQIVARGRSGGHIAARELAAYPSLLKNPAVADQLSRLLEMETQRTKLLGSVRENDPQIGTLNRMISEADSQLMLLAENYLSGLHRQEEGLRRDLASYRSRLGVLPAKAETAYRRQREVKRLSETLIAIQSQLVQAQLDAITEGGQVRQVDVAVRPDRPAFPNKPLSLFGGLLGGIFFGIVGGVAAGRRREVLHEAWEVELATGVRAVDFNPRLPLGYGEAGSGQTLLIVPVGGGDSSVGVGEQIARTAALQGENPVLADLRGVGVREGSLRAATPIAVPALREGEESGERGSLTVVKDGVARYPAAGSTSNATPRAILETLEERYTPVIAVLPSMESPEAVGALRPGRQVVLSAVAGRVSRTELAATVALCRQMEVRPVGVVVVPAGEEGARA
jgi:tyrosine-protein kinase Etk/Wzc